MIEIERQALKKKAEIERKSFQSLVQKLNEVSLTFTRRAGEKDIIFGSVSAGDVKEALDGLGYEIDKKKILLDEPIKRLGNFTVPVKISVEDRAEVKIVVAREEAAGAGAGAGGRRPAANSGVGGRPAAGSRGPWNST